MPRRLSFNAVSGSGSELHLGQPHPVRLSGGAWDTMLSRSTAWTVTASWSDFRFMPPLLPNLSTSSSPDNAIRGSQMASPRTFQEVPVDSGFLLRNLVKPSKTPIQGIPGNSFRGSPVGSLEWFSSADCTPCQNPWRWKWCFSNRVLVGTKFGASKTQSLKAFRSLKNCLH